MAAWPVVLEMNVDGPECARKIRKAVEDMRGVESVWASPEQGLVVVHGTADPWALTERIWRKMGRDADVVGDGSAPYYGLADPPRYGPSQAYGWGAAPAQHSYYSYPNYADYSHQQTPPHAYYSQPRPPPPRYPHAVRSNQQDLITRAWKTEMENWRAREDEDIFCVMFYLLLFFFSFLLFSLRQI